MKVRERSEGMKAFLLEKTSAFPPRDKEIVRAVVANSATRAAKIVKKELGITVSTSYLQLVGGSYFRFREIQALAEPPL